MYTKHQWTTDHYFNFKYTQYLPKDFDPKKKYPLVFFLHGAGERGDDLDLACFHGPMKYVREDNQEYPFIIIAPQCPKEKYWACFTESLIAFMDYICETLPVDEDRVCLTGLSMGGTGTWMLAMADPKRFACIVPICGSGIYWNAESIKNLPIMIYHGDNDEAVPITESIAMMKAVNKLGGHAEIKICYGKGHNVWEIAYQDPALYDWMMKQKRK